MVTQTTLVIGDAHCEADDDLRRFEALGNYIIDVQPDNIVSIGDFLTLDSLSSYDLSKSGKREGKRFHNELAHGALAMDTLMKPIKEYNEEQKKYKKKQYHPVKYFLEGNHEDRFERYLDHHPELKGVVSLAQTLKLEQHKWEWIPYRGYCYIEGVAFTHIPMNAINKPLTGERKHINATRDHVQPVVYGHSHELAIISNARHGEQDQQIFAVNCGCFFEEVPNYAKGSKGSKNWWSGVLMLSHYDEGRFDLSTIRLERLLGEYL